MSGVTIGLVVVILVLALAVGVLVYLVFRKLSGGEDDKGVFMLQKELQDMRRSFDEKLGVSAKEMQESMRSQLSESTKIVREVTEGLTKLGETNKQVISFADQLKNLQDVLQNPKQRGILGEYYLETVLQNVLPPDSFKMQYAFKDGEIVDAAVFVKDKIVPVDSKFSLENYNKMVAASDSVERDKIEKIFVHDLKLRIQETAKYIRPAEKTTDFAFMFIPSEGIYYDLLTNNVGADEESLIQRAANKYRVIIVSPTSFLAYLQTVLQGLRGLEIEEKAQDIIKNVGKLSTHLQKYEDFYRKLGNSLSTTVNHWNAGHKEFQKVDKDILRITGEAMDIEPELLERPREE